MISLIDPYDTPEPRKVVVPTKSFGPATITWGGQTIHVKDVIITHPPLTFDEDDLTA